MNKTMQSREEDCHVNWVKESYIYTMALSGQINTGVTGERQKRIREKEGWQILVFLLPPTVPFLCHFCPLPIPSINSAQ